MKVEIINIYSNEAPKGSDLKGDHGQSFLIKTDKQNILFDVGSKGKILTHNMGILNIDPNDIDIIILSHGHYDHTAALPTFLDKRNSKKLPVYAHPEIREKKTGKLGPLKLDLGFPELTPEQENKIEFIYDTNPVHISNCISTTGEISNRNELNGLESKSMRTKNGELVVDQLPDDLSLIVSTKEGEVIIAGCAHSGILNICKAVQGKENKKIRAIIGGTHMVSYTDEEVLHVSNILKTDFEQPDLFLNHCTDKLPVPFKKKTKAFDIISNDYQLGKVEKCYVGTSYIFEC